jgi:hypothetical protein
MAIPTVSGSYPYPNPQGPERTFYQGYAAGATQGILRILPTITTSGSFVATNLMVSCYDASAGAAISVRIKNDEIFKLSGASISSHVISFNPGVRSAAAIDTNTCDLNITGATAGASCYILGYFD